MFFDWFSLVQVQEVQVSKNMYHGARQFNYFDLGRVRDPFVTFDVHGVPLDLHEQAAVTHLVSQLRTLRNSKLILGVGTGGSFPK